MLLGKDRPLDPLVCDISLCFVTFPFGVSSHVTYLIVPIPDLYQLLYFYDRKRTGLKFPLHIMRGGSAVYYIPILEDFENASPYLCTFLANRICD